MRNWTMRLLMVSSCFFHARILRTKALVTVQSLVLALASRTNLLRPGSPPRRRSLNTPAAQESAALGLPQPSPLLHAIPEARAGDRWREVQ